MGQQAPSKNTPMPKRDLIDNFELTLAYLKETEKGKENDYSTRFYGLVCTRRFPDQPLVKGKANHSLTMSNSRGCYFTNPSNETMVLLMCDLAELTRLA